MLIIVGLSFILSLNFFRKEVKGFFYYISAPLQEKLWGGGSGVSSFFGAILRAGSLEEENDNLKLEIQSLLSQQNNLRDLQEENQSLREALGIGLQKDFRLELVNVISKDTDRDVVLIDKGSAYGLSKGLPLISSQKVLIGNIIEVYQNYSKVLLISSKESSFEAQVSRGNIAGLAKGLGKSQIFLDLISKDAQIKEGDLVVSGVFSVGLVKEIIKIDINPFQGAEVSTFFDIGGLDKAFVVLNL